MSDVRIEVCCALPVIRTADYNGAAPPSPCSGMLRVGYPVHGAPSMRTRLPYISISRIIVHDIPRRLKASTGDIPIYSEVESPLDGPTGPQLRAFFRDRIVECANSSGALDVVFDANASSVVPGLVTDWLQGPSADLVAMSKQIGEHLHRSQPGASPPGLVTVIDCPLSADPAIAVLKLERDEGVRLQQLKVDGQPTFSIERIPDLMLTQRTKVFKLAIFTRGSDGVVRGLVVDHQRGYFEKAEVATYFLRDFLGCALQQEPSVVTKHFSDAAQEYFNDQIPDPELRSQLMLHLVSEMLRATPTLSPRKFAEDYIPLSNRQAFLDHLKTSSVSDTPFPKDISQMKRHLSRVAYEFASGITILGSQEVLEERMKLSMTDNGSTKVEIEDQLKQIRTRA